MQLTRNTALLFTLNFLDAVFTLYWVRFGFAQEGNQLMAGLLDMGDFPFLFVKIAIGAAAAYVLSEWSDFKIARYGVALCLGIYLGLMLIHFATGLTAFGIVSGEAVDEFSSVTHSVFAVFVS